MTTSQSTINLHVFPEKKRRRKNRRWKSRKKVPRTNCVCVLFHGRNGRIPAFPAIGTKGTPPLPASRTRLPRSPSLRRSPRVSPALDASGRTGSQRVSTVSRSPECQVAFQDVTKENRSTYVAVLIFHLLFSLPSHLPAPLARSFTPLLEHADRCINENDRLLLPAARRHL